MPLPGWFAPLDNAGTWHKLPVEVVGVPTRNVVLTHHQEELIASLVATGRYQNASEVLREGLRLLEREDAIFEAKLRALREAAQAGWDDIAADRYTDLGSDGLRAHIADIGDRAGRHADAV